MSRRLRFHPEDSLVEVTCRTVQGRLLLHPTPRVSDLCRGVLARAARLYPVRIHAFTFLGNHYHLLLTASDAHRLAAFMRYLNSNLAREIGRTVGWRERFWGRRYQAILVSAEESAQIGRLLYILRHGCKENLVRRPKEWPGASAVHGLVTGAPIVGSWLDRTALYEANRHRRRHQPGEFVARERLDLAPLPCWAHLNRGVYCRRVAELVRQVERETETRIRKTGQAPLGRRRLRRQNPHQALGPIRSRPAPLVHAATRRMRNSLKEAFGRFVSAYRRASERLRKIGFAEELLEQFPAGCFLPPIPLLAHPGGAPP